MERFRSRGASLTERELRVSGSDPSAWHRPSSEVRNDHDWRVVWPTGTPNLFPAPRSVRMASAGQTSVATASDEEPRQRE
jgi:hypothetical protein